MLGPIDNIVNAGIRFEANVRDIDRAESKLGSLSRKMKETGASGILMSEGTEKANRSLDEQARDAGAASAGLAGLQSQLATTTAAQKALDESSGSLSHTLRGLDDDAQGMVIDEVVEDIHGAVNDLDSLPNHFDFDAKIKGREGTRELVKLLGDVEDTEIGDIFEFENDNLDALEETKEVLDRLDDLDSGDNRFRQILGSYNAKGKNDIALDPRSADFPPEDSDLLADDGPGAHIFDQLARNSPYDSFQELDESGDDIAEYLDAGVFPGLNTDRDIKNINGATEEGEKRTKLFETQDFIDSDDYGSGYSNLLEDELKEVGVDTVEDFFRASDETIEEAMEGTAFSGVTKPDEIRQKAIEALSTREFENDKGIVRKMGVGNDTAKDMGARNIAFDQQRMALETLRRPQGLKKMIDGQMPEDITNEPEVRDALIDLVSLMEGNEEANRAINEIMSDSDSILHAKSLIGNKDDHNELQVRDELRNNIREIAASAFDADAVSEQVGISDGDDFFKKLMDESGYSPSQAEKIANTMAELDPRLVKGQGKGKSFPVTRETVGMRTMQEMLDTDPDSDRQDTLKSVLQSIYHPETGMQSTLFDQEEMMKGEFYEGLKKDLPRGLTSPGGFSSSRRQPDVARDIVQELIHGDDTDGMGIEDFLGDDSENVGDLIGRAINRSEYNDKDVLRKASRATEDFLPAVYEKYASQLSPGLNTSARGSTEADIVDLFPGLDVLNPEENRAGEIKPNTEGWMKEFDNAFMQIRSSQESSGTLRGGAFTGLFGGDGNRKGLFGGLSELFASTKFGNPRNVKKFNDRLEGMADRYKRLNPLLRATSFNLGPLNLNFEGVQKMAFKLTATLGPLIVALGGLAGAAVAATGAMVGFMAAGAVGFLEDMEDTMAGVSDKQDAMSELASTLGQMANEAITPLKMARLGGDGNTAAQSFVELLRGGLQILNRMANVMAYVMELDEVADQAQRISDFLLNSDGDSQLARQFGELVTEVLPLINDIVIAILGNMGGFMEYASGITRILGDELMSTLGNIKPILSLLTSYGSGFFTVALRMISIFAKLGHAIYWVLARFADLISILPGVSVTANNLTFALGGLIGAMSVIGGMGSIISSNVLMIATAFKSAAIAANLFTASNYGLASSLFIVAAALSLVLASAWLVKDIVKRIGELEPELSFDFAKDLGIILGEMVALVTSLVILSTTLLTKFASVGTVVGNIATHFGVSLGFLAGWKATLGNIVWMAKWLAGGLLTSIKGTIAGISLGTVGWVAAIGTAVALFADLMYYLKTGDSFILDWGEHIEWLNTKLERTLELLDQMPGYERDTMEDGERFGGYDNEVQRNFGNLRKILGPIVGGFGMGIADRFAGNTAMAAGGTDGFGLTSAHVKALGTEAASGFIGGDGGSTSTSTSSASTTGEVTVNIDQSMSDKQIARVARREIEAWWRKEMK